MKRVINIETVLFIFFTFKILTGQIVVKDTIHIQADSVYHIQKWDHLKINELYGSARGLFEMFRQGDFYYKGCEYEDNFLYISPDSSEIRRVIVFYYYGGYAESASHNIPIFLFPFSDDYGGVLRISVDWDWWGVLDFSYPRMMIWKITDSYVKEYTVEFRERPSAFSLLCDVGEKVAVGVILNYGWLDYLNNSSLPGFPIADVKLVCDDEYKITWDFNGVQKGVVFKGFYTGLYTFDVYFEPDTIAYQDTTTLYAVACKQEEPDAPPVPITDESLLELSLWEEYIGYGRLIGPDGQTGASLSNLRYGDVRSGKVRFVADGTTIPKELTYLYFTLKPMGEKCPEAFPWLTIQPSADTLDTVMLDLEIPKANEIYYITPSPTMPTLECRAKLSGNNLKDNYMANWECKLEYHYPPGSDERMYSEDNFFDSNYISNWGLNFNNSVPIIGGNVNIKVSTLINSKIYSDSVRIYIRGENPSSAVVLNGLDNGEIAMLRTESSNLAQFDTENYDTPHIGLPLRGADSHGWGLCQIDDRSHRITTALLWDWTANREYGLNYYNQQRDRARARLESIGHLDTPAEGQTWQSMIDSEGYARYNGGPSARYWEWVEPRRKTPGHWIAFPTTLKSGERKFNPVLWNNVSHYIRNYSIGGSQ